MWDFSLTNRGNEGGKEITTQMDYIQLAFCSTVQEHPLANSQPLSVSKFHTHWLTLSNITGLDVSPSSCNIKMD